MKSPTHSKSEACLQRGIFDGLKSFRELETRISALPTAQERGAAFEVFAEAYLAVLAVEKAQAVWPGSRIPPTLRKRLALRTADMGVDGIIETQLGEVHAYQAKFRTGRPSLNWTELSTFIGIAVAHQLTFAEAARRGIICQYRVVVFVVTSGMVNDHLLRHGEVLVQGDAVQARRSRRWKCSRSRANSRTFTASTFDDFYREARF